jgi:hypothetical protein
MANQIVVSAGAKVRNLSGVLTGTSGVVSSVPLGAANGVATLDSGGKVPVSQLPSSVVTYLGTWNAATNTPTLANGTGDAGDMYICNVAGTVNFGAGPVVFVVGDWVLYGSGTWQKSSGQNGTVTSVAITETGDSLNITGSPITTSGTINIGFNGTNLQYVNGAGNLTTFPILTGYVPYTGATANLNLGIYSFIANDGAYNTEMSPSYFGVENAAGTIFGLLEYNKLTLTNSTGAGSTMIVNAQGLIFPDASVQTSSYTDAKARLALSLTTTGTSGVATYNNATGVFNIPNYGSGLSGYVPYTGATTDVDLGAFKLNAQSLHIKGTGGNGHLGLKHQSASATASANEVSLFADSLGDLSWLNGNLYLSKFITSGNTAARSYTFPDATCNIPNDSLVVHLAGTETITGAKTFSGGVTFTSSLTTTGNVTFSNSGFTLVLQPPTLSVNRTVTLPNGTGTLALTSDISYPVTSVFGRTGAVVATSGDYTTTLVTEGTNLYFTDSRARLALSFVAGSGAYNSTTGVITIPTNNTQITNGSNYITLGSLSAGTGISYNNTTGVITNSLPDQTVALTASTGISVTGTYPNFTITNTSPSSGGTVTSVAALTIGTSGTDLSSSVATSTTTPVITLNVPTASASNRGALSSADWSTFNSKQGTITLTTTGTSGAATFSSNTLNIPQYQGVLTNPVTGTGTTNYLPKFTGASTIGNSAITDDGTTVTLVSRALSGTSASFSGNITASGTGNIVIQAASSNNFPLFQLVDSRVGGTTWNIEGGRTLGNLQIRSNIAGGTVLEITSIGNLGLGVTPSAWVTASGRTAMQIGITSVSTNSANDSFFGTNYYDDGTNNRYINTDFSLIYAQQNGNHIWYNAPSGTAGNAISFTQAMTLTASGNLGIGSSATSPLSKLSIGGNGYTGRAITAYANNADYAITFQQDNGSGGGLQMFSTAATWGADPIRISDGTSTQLNLKSNGNLLIGTTSDSGYKLDVNGTGRFSSTSYTNLYVDGTNATGWGNNMAFRSQGTDFGYIGSIGSLLGSTTKDMTIWATAGNGFGVYTNGNNQRLYIASTGAATFSSSVGIGTTATNTTLTAYQSNSALNALSITHINGNGILVNASYNYYDAYNHIFRGLGGSSTFMTITNTGNVGIGISSPTYLLDVNKSVAGDHIARFYNTSATGYGIFLKNADNTKPVIRAVDASDNIIFDVKQSGVTATAFFESSDSRLKTLIQDNYQTKGIASITPKLYTKNGKVELGYYAQDFVGVLDSAVSKGSDDMLSLSYREVLVAKVYALEQEIKELKAKMN